MADACSPAEAPAAADAAPPHLMAMIKAARLIQKLTRGNKGRSKAATVRTHKLRHNAAAASIQALIRGKQTRILEHKQLEVLEGYSSTVTTSDVRSECGCGARRTPPPRLHILH
jgi:hypothetical protein